MFVLRQICRILNLLCWANFQYGLSGWIQWGSGANISNKRTLISLCLSQWCVVFLSFYHHFNNAGRFSWWLQKRIWRYQYWIPHCVDNQIWWKLLVWLHSSRKLSFISKALQNSSNAINITHFWSIFTPVVHFLQDFQEMKAGTTIDILALMRASISEERMKLILEMVEDVCFIVRLIIELP